MLLTELERLAFNAAWNPLRAGGRLKPDGSSPRLRLRVHPAQERGKPLKGLSGEPDPSTAFVDLSRRQIDVATIEPDEARHGWCSRPQAARIYRSQLGRSHTRSRLRGRTGERLALDRHRGPWSTEANPLRCHMNVSINAKRLRASLPEVVERVRKGTRFTIIYRSRPAFQIVPVTEEESPVPLGDDPLYRAEPVGRSSDGRSAAEHDAVLYRR